MARQHIATELSNAELPRGNGIVDDVPEVIQSLRAILGRNVTAVIAGVSDPAMVDAWARGDEAPEPSIGERLIHALRVTELLKERQTDEDVLAWFVGRNSQLGGRAPASMMAIDPQRVEDAACAFLAY